jgi:hypothetical protein
MNTFAGARSSALFATHTETASIARKPAKRSGILAYFASDGVRAVQTVLGLIWLLDGGLQFQSFMYSKAGFPARLGSSVDWGARLAGGNLDLWNTLFALTQVLIGLGLLFRPTVKLALAGSFVWVAIVWWFGEAFGMLFANAASPLTGAPGAVLLYGLIGLIAWPNGRPGGLLGARGARIAWAVVWVLMGWLWLIGANSSANAVSSAIGAAPSGMGWLNSVLTHAAKVAEGNGLFIAAVLAAVSILIGVAVGLEWHARTFLWLAIYLNALYWVVGQGFGGLATGSATDVNAGPLFILFACAIFTTLPPVTERPQPVRPAVTTPQGALG